MTNGINRSIRWTFAAIGMLVLCQSARADLVGLRVFREGLYGSATPVDGPLWIYRVYAEFTESSDAVLAWGGGSGLGSAQIRNMSISGSPGTGFNNVPDNDSGNSPPYHPLSVSDWDTYMTIGLLYGDLAPGGISAASVGASTPTFISHGTTSWAPTQSGFISLNNPFAPQGRANYLTMLGNDNEYRVLLMQLVVHSDEHVDGSIGVFWRNESSSFITSDVSFSSIPAPSPFVSMLLGLVLIRRRRR